MWLLHACIDTYSYPHVHNMPVVDEAFAVPKPPILRRIPEATLEYHMFHFPSLTHQYPLTSPNTNT